jgi:hypothetical protein
MNPGDRRQAPDIVFQVPVGILRIGVSPGEFRVRRRLGHGLRRRPHRRIPAKGTLQGIIGGDLKRLGIVLGRNQVRFVVTDVRTLLQIAATRRPRQDPKESFFKEATIIGELLLQLSGC